MTSWIKLLLLGYLFTGGLYSESIHKNKPFLSYTVFVKVFITAKENLSKNLYCLNSLAVYTHQRLPMRRTVTDISCLSCPCWQSMGHTVGDLGLLLKLTHEEKQ